MITIICDKQGSGKTVLAPIFKNFFECKRIVDEWNPYGKKNLKDGDLALTNCAGTFVVPSHCQVFSVDGPSLRLAEGVQQDLVMGTRLDRIYEQHGTLTHTKESNSGRQRTTMSFEVKTATLGEQIDAIYDLKQQKKGLEEQAEEIQKLIDARELLLLDELDKQGTVKATGRRASVSITETIVPQVEDWDAYYTYIRRNNAFELLQRRPSVEAWREHALNRRDKTVPGTVPFTKRKASIRTT